MLDLQFDTCEGCDEGAEQIDHKHQYIGFAGTAVMTWIVDGVTYTSFDEAVKYIMDTYDVSANESWAFFKKIPFKIN